MSLFYPPHQVNIYQSKVGVAISDQINIRAKSIPRDKEVHWSPGRCSNMCGPSYSLSASFSQRPLETHLFLSTGCNQAISFKSQESIAQE